MMTSYSILSLKPALYMPISRTTTITDELDRDVEILAELYDPAVQTWLLDSRLEMFPRGYSPELLDSVQASGWSANINDWGCP